MSAESAPLTLTPGPHLHDGMSTTAIMWWVNAAIFPALVWGAIVYHPRVLLLLASSVAGALVVEWGVTSLRHQRPTTRDGSAVLTGLLLAGTLPPAIPLWMPAVGSAFAILFGKMLFGGLGFNIFNPALIGRAFLMACFPVAMTTGWLPTTHATPLAAWKLEAILPSHMSDLLWGFRAGSIGEASLPLLALGGAILLWKRIITLWIPSSVVFGLLLISLFSDAPFLHLVSGGLWYGALFMATDYVTAPTDVRAQMIFGLAIGLLTGVIRLWGGYPEGICYAILILNATTPALNRWFRPRRVKPDEGALS